jgi:hypothetical protein
LSLNLQNAYYPSSKCFHSFIFLGVDSENQAGKFMCFSYSSGAFKFTELREEVLSNAEALAYVHDY